MTRPALARVALITRAAALAAIPILATSATASFAQTISNDKAITVVLAVEPDSLDPCDTQTANNANVVRGNIFQSLTAVSPVDGTVQPLLATSWQHVSPQVWTFKLREGVKFHDGSTFDAQTAAANIRRSQAGTDFYGGKLACYNSEQFDGKVVAEAIDSFTLKVTTEKPDPILPLRLSYIDMGNLASQNSDSKITDPIGTGPYKFVSRAQGQFIKLTRFDDYWGDRPEVENVTYVYRAESAVRAGMISTGEAQIATQIRPEDATDDDRTVSFSDNRILLVRLMSSKEPFVDPRVRQAVSLSIDRDTIVPAIMGRTGSPWYQMLGPQVNGYIPDFDNSSLEYDPEKAKALIEAAKADGHAVDTPFLIITRPDVIPAGNEITQAIGQNLKDVGFNFRILSLETAAWLQYLRQPFPDDQPATLQLISHDNTTGDASFSFPKYITCHGPVSSTCNSDIDALVSEAGQSEGQKRSQLYQEAARLLYTKDYSMFGVAEQNQLMLLGEGIEYKANSLSGLEIRIADVHFVK